MSLLRASVRVPAEAAEGVRVTMLTLFPEGFEESEAGGQIEFAAYTDEPGAARARETFDVVSVAPVADGWEDAWKEFHQPVRVGPLWIGPPWEHAPADAVNVVIDPGRAFGTGAHATTRLTLELLLELERGSMLDVGCGSGVLAIAAAKLGFEPVRALDADPAAVEAARRNALANDVAIGVAVADGLAAELPETHVAVANIEASVVRGLAALLRCRFLIGSGYYLSEAIELRGFRRLDRREEERWAADLFERTG